MSLRRTNKGKKSITLKDVIVHMNHGFAGVHKQLATHTIAIQNLNVKVDALDKSLTTRIDTLEKDLTERIDAVSERIDALDEDLTATIKDTLVIRRHVGMPVQSAE